MLEHTHISEDFFGVQTEAQDNLPGLTSETQTGSKARRIFAAKQDDTGPLPLVRDLETVEFGVQQSLEPALFSLALRNGNADAVRVTLGLKGESAFSIASDWAGHLGFLEQGQTLKPGETARLVLAFQPDSAGRFSGTLTLDYHDGKLGSAQDIALSGTAMGA